MWRPQPHIIVTANALLFILLKVCNLEKIIWIPEVTSESLVSNPTANVSRLTHELHATEVTLSPL